MHRTVLWIRRLRQGLGRDEGHADARHGNQRACQRERRRAAGLDAHVRVGAFALDMAAQCAHAKVARRELAHAGGGSVHPLGHDELAVPSDVDAEVRFTVEADDGLLHATTVEARA